MDACALCNILPLPVAYAFNISSLSYIVPPVGKSGPGTISINSSGDISDLKSGYITSPLSLILSNIVCISLL